MAPRHLLALLPVVAASAVTAVVMPRGPDTAGRALTAMALGAAAGLAAGYLSRSRWSMLTAPLVTAVIVELGHLGHVGLTVEPPAVEPGSHHGAGGGRRAAGAGDRRLLPSR